MYGDGQTGTVGRCVDIPLIVNAYNPDKPDEFLEGIPLLYEIVQGGGIFKEEPGYSTVTDEGGDAALHYHYGTTAGVNRVRVSVLGDSTVTPVEFTLTGLP